MINILLAQGKEAVSESLTTKKYGAITKVSRATAFREIVDMLQKGVVVQVEAKGRSVSYRLNMK